MSFAEADVGREFCCGLELLLTSFRIAATPEAESLRVTEKAHEKVEINHLVMKKSNCVI